MIGTSWKELVLIRISIALLTYLPIVYAALLVGNLACRQSRQHYGLVNIIFSIALGCELLFFTLVYLPHKRRLHHEAKHPPLPSPQRRQQLFETCIENVPHIESYLRGWFLGAELADIRRENLREFYMWAFFDMDMAKLKGDARESGVMNEVDGYISATERRLGRRIADGLGRAQCLRLTLDETVTTYRCLTWYLVVMLIDLMTHWILSSHGFMYFARSNDIAMNTFPPRPQELLASRRSKAETLGYWYRPHRSTDTMPVVFFHGIGVGLWTYIQLILQLTSQPNRAGEGMIIPEFLSISFRLTDCLLDRAAFLEAIGRIIDQHFDQRQFLLVSHSFGSILTTHMLNSTLKEQISSVVLIDPVTILLHLPTVAYNFTRRLPKKADEWQLWYYASKDIGVATCLSRHFFWRQNILWKEDLISFLEEPTSIKGSRSKKRAIVCLSGKDIIIDADTVACYLQTKSHRTESHDHKKTHLSKTEFDKVEVVFFPHLNHAQVFDSRLDLQHVETLIRACSMSL